MASKEKRSKKRSGTKLPLEKQLENVVFFVDRCLGKNTVPETLRQAGLRVEVHSDHFQDDAPDTHWLIECGKRDWVVLTKDREIRRNDLERIALMNSGVASFILISANSSGLDNANALSKSLPKIARFLQTRPKPFIARINKNGEVELWIDHKGKDHLKH
ncbi:MAG: hypothetical protein HYR56_31880 [Acidobacteria bacterium]|nr:hypothetical protein [Acidobacteriota bacterium]MBI3424294.1 hypothetical protein [Acidobacteriota bacterium]